MTVATAQPHPLPSTPLSTTWHPRNCNKKSCQHSQNTVEEAAAAVGSLQPRPPPRPLVAAPKPKVKCPWRIYVACGMLHVAILSFFRQCRKRKQQKLIVLESAVCIYHIIWGIFCEVLQGAVGGRGREVALLWHVAVASRGLIITHKPFDCKGN